MAMTNFAPTTQQGREFTRNFSWTGNKLEPIDKWHRWQLVFAAVPAAAMLDTYFFPSIHSWCLFFRTQRADLFHPCLFFPLQHRTTREAVTARDFHHSTPRWTWNKRNSLGRAFFAFVVEEINIFICSAAHVTYSLQTHLYNRADGKKRSCAFARGHVIFHFLELFLSFNYCAVRCNRIATLMQLAAVTKMQFSMCVVFLVAFAAAASELST